MRHTRDNPHIGRGQTSTVSVWNDDRGGRARVFVRREFDDPRYRPAGYIITRADAEAIAAMIFAERSRITTKAEQDAILACAKGDVQREVLHELLGTGQVVARPELRPIKNRGPQEVMTYGSGVRTLSGSSWHGLNRRLREAGFELTRERDPGSTTIRFRLKEKEA